MAAERSMSRTFWMTLIVKFWIFLSLRGRLMHVWSFVKSSMTSRIYDSTWTGNYIKHTDRACQLSSNSMNPVEDTRREVGIHLSDDDMGVGWVLYDGEIHQTVPEHRHTIYRYVITVRPLWGVRKGTWAQERIRWWEQAPLELAGAQNAAETEAERNEKEEWMRGSKVGLLGWNNRRELKVEIYN